MLEKIKNIILFDLIKIGLFTFLLNTNLASASPQLLSKITLGSQLPQMMITKISWEQPVDPTTSYQIDESLSPIVRKYFNFQLTPSLVSSNGSASQLKPGFYVLRLAMLRPLTTDEKDTNSQDALDIRDTNKFIARYIGGREKIFQITAADSGNLNLRIPFDFRSISALNLRNTLLVQILPVKKSSLQFDANGFISSQSKYEIEMPVGYQAFVTRIPFIPRVGSGSATPPRITSSEEITEETLLDLRELISQSQKAFDDRLKKDLAPVSPSAYAQKYKMKLLTPQSTRLFESLSSMSQFKEFPTISAASFIQQISRKEISDLTLPEILAGSFCRLLIKEASLDLKGAAPLRMREEEYAQNIQMKLFRECVLRPENHFNLVRNTHVYKMSRDPQDTRYISGFSSSISLTANFSLNRGESIENSEGYNIGINFLMAPLDIMGIIRAGKSYSASRSQSRSTTQSIGLSQTIPLEMNQWDVAFKINSSVQCLAILPKKYSSNWTLTTQLRGVYVCDDKVDSNTYEDQEKYYFIYPSTTAGATIDPQSTQSQVANFVLRSQRDYVTFLNMIQMKLSPLYPQGSQLQETINMAADTYRSTPPPTPGVLSKVVSLKGGMIEKRMNEYNSPSFWNRILFRHVENIK